MSGSAVQSPNRSVWPSGPGSTSCPPTRSEAAAQEAGLDEPTTEALVDDYESAQLQALKTGLLAAAFLALLSLAFTRDLPHGPLEKEPKQRATSVGP